MNYLVDANLSPSIAEQLRVDGREAVHVFDIGLATAPSFSSDVQSFIFFARLAPPPRRSVQ